MEFPYRNEEKTYRIGNKIDCAEGVISNKEQENKIGPTPWKIGYFGLVLLAARSNPMVFLG